MRVLVTGAAGFIGMHVTERLLARGDEVVGFDNVNDYYDPAVKRGRLGRLAGFPGFTFQERDLRDGPGMRELFASWRPQRVVHLAAQAGVRYSLEQPHSYIDSNITGFLNVLEACRHQPVEHLVYASSSSVYGANTRQPLSVHDHTDHPVSLYAASKKANEMMAHAYSHLFGIATTGLRFFTVYGPWGRPDMALFKFTRAILAGEPIQVFNNGDMYRDFTYIDDIVEGVVRVLDQAPLPGGPADHAQPDPAVSLAPYRLYNIGNNNPVRLLDFIELIEAELGKLAIKELLPMQPGDVRETYADVDALRDAVGFVPRTPLAQGVRNYIQWYRSFYGI